MTIYFCSGHRNLSNEEFAKNYIPLFENISNDIENKFILGDCIGGDLLCLVYLLSKGIPNITIYHMFQQPREPFFTLINDINKNIPVEKRIKTKGGYKSDSARDKAMTGESDQDIVWHRSIEDISANGNYNPKFKSGVLKNILRRDSNFKLQ